MGFPIGPYPGNTKAIEEFTRLAKLKEVSRLKTFVWKYFGKKKTQQYFQWLAVYYEWRGVKMLTGLIFNGKVVEPATDIEQLSKQIHLVYCQYYRDVRGEEYWTKGNYDLLDEATKEADRYMARFILTNFEPRDAEQSFAADKNGAPRLAAN